MKNLKYLKDQEASVSSTCLKLKEHIGKNNETNEMLVIARKAGNSNPHLNEIIIKKKILV